MRSPASVDPATKPAQPGRASLTQQLGDVDVAAPPLFAGDPVWEDLAGEQGAPADGSASRPDAAAGAADAGGSEAEEAAPASVSLKAISLSLGDSLASSPIGAQLAQDEEGEQGRGAQGAPGELAEEGFRGTPTALPHRAELEQSFGTSFAGVKAYTDEHARDAAEGLGAKAYAAGDQIAFGTPNPDKALVAHELTHVLQHTGQGPAKKSEGGGDGGIDLSGEAEAERVEAAVSSGQPARAALEGGGGPAHGGRANGPAPAGAGPALARRLALAKSSFGTGMTFSPTGFEKTSRYELWKAPSIEVPVGAVPGLNLLVSPSMSVSAGAGVNMRKKRLKARLGLSGGVGVGFSYGKSEIAALYGQMRAGVSGGFTYERDKSRGRIRNWELDGRVKLTTNFAIGVKLGGGIVDAKFEFGHCDIGELFGLEWQNGNFDRSKIGWTWGAQPQSFFGKIRSLIEKVKRILNLPKDAAKKAWKEVGGVVKGLGGIVKKIDLTPWDGLFPF